MRDQHKSLIGVTYESVVVLCGNEKKATILFTKVSDQLCLKKVPVCLVQQRQKKTS